LNTVHLLYDQSVQGAKMNEGTTSKTDLALLVLRIALAIVFLYHGSAILFGAFDGPGPAGFAAYKHWPLAVGYLVGLAQFGGGLAALLGVFSRIGAACLIVVMIGAIVTVHLPNGYSLAHNGYEFALNELLTAVVLLLTGPGRYALDRTLPASIRNL
jgi:putative oxidoreductase